MDERIIVGVREYTNFTLFPAGGCVQEQIINELTKIFLNLIFVKNWGEYKNLNLKTNLKKRCMTELGLPSPRRKFYEMRKI